MNIDRIAREMVNVEPSADLEARIRARLDDARPGRSVAWWAVRVGVPVGAAAALALALSIGVPWTRSPEVVETVAAPAGAVAEAGPEVVNAFLPPKITTSQLPKSPTSQLTSEEAAWMDRRIPALDAVTGLQVERLLVDSIQPEPLAITPLTMTVLGPDGAGVERRNDR